MWEGSRSKGTKNILVVLEILCLVIFYSFARRAIERNRLKGSMGSLGIISHNCLWIYNYLK